MHFLSFLTSAFLATYLFKSLMRGLVPLSDRWAQRIMGLPGIEPEQFSQRRPRAAAAWNFFQAVSVGALYAMVIAALLWGYELLGMHGWLYSAAAMLWALSSAFGFKTNPGSIFFSCLLGVLFFLFFGFAGNLIAWLCFMPIFIAILRAKTPISTSDNAVIIDVDAEI